MTQIIINSEIHLNRIKIHIDMCSKALKSKKNRKHSKSSKYVSFRLRKSHLFEDLLGRKSSKRCNFRPRKSSKSSRDTISPPLPNLSLGLLSLSTPLFTLSITLSRDSNTSIYLKYIVKIPPLQPIVTFSPSSPCVSPEPCQCLTGSPFLWRPLQLEDPYHWGRSRCHWALPQCHSRGKTCKLPWRLLRMACRGSKK